MGQQHLPGNIADRVDTGHVRLHPVIHDDLAALAPPDARGFKPDPLRVHAAPDGHQHLGGPDLLAVREHGRQCAVAPLRSVSILAPVTSLILAFFISRSMMADISSSSVESARGSISTRVTSAPKRGR